MKNVQTKVRKCTKQNFTILSLYILFFLHKYFLFKIYQKNSFETSLDLGTSNRYQLEFDGLVGESYKIRKGKFRYIGAVFNYKHVFFVDTSFVSQNSACAPLTPPRPGGHQVLTRFNRIQLVNGQEQGTHRGSQYTPFRRNHFRNSVRNIESRQISRT